MTDFATFVPAAKMFLTNRASLRRVTNFRELRRVLRETTGYRVSRDRDKIAQILRAVDDASLAEQDVMLSALVVHFWDDGVGHRFGEQVIERGLLVAEPDDSEAIRQFHADQLAKVFAAYPEFVPATAPDDASEINEDENADV